MACGQQLRLTRSCASSEWGQCSERVSATPLPDQPITKIARNTIVPIPSSQTALRAGPLWSEQRKGLTRIEAQPLNLGGVSANDTRSGLQPRSDAARLLCPRLPSSILILLYHRHPSSLEPLLLDKSRLSVITPADHHIPAYRPYLSPLHHHDTNIAVLLSLSDQSPQPLASFSHNPPRPLLSRILL